MKKLNKLFAILVAMAMVLSLTVVSAFAVDKSGNAITNGTAEDPANIAIEKILDVAEGTTIPGTTFKFDVAATSTTAEKNPSAGTVTGYNTTVEATVDTSTGKGVTGFVFTGNEVFQNAGTYYFKVNEKVPTVDEVKAIDGYANSEVTVANNVVTIKTGDVTEIYTYDTADRYIVVGVAVTKGPNGEDVKYINSIAVVDEETKKVTLKEVEVTIPGEQGQESTTKEGYAFDVENNYQKIETNALAIGKTCVNDQSNADGQTFDPSKKFLFHVTLNKPSTAPATTTVYHADIYEGDTKVSETPIEFNATGTTDVELKHGQTLKFSDIDYGTTYAVTEDDYSAIGYTASGEIAEANAVTLNDNVAASKSATITNTYKYSDDKTNTGITMNNLPFIVLALVAIGGLVAYVVVRRRNADEA